VCGDSGVLDIGGKVVVDEFDDLEYAVCDDLGE
jgi:hypothetical protein